MGYFKPAIQDAVPDGELYVVLTENTVMSVTYRNGFMCGVRGMRAKVQQAELNVVMITLPGGKVHFLELGEGVFWLPEKEVYEWVT